MVPIMKKISATQILLCLCILTVPPSYQVGISYIRSRQLNRTRTWLSSSRVNEESAVGNSIKTLEKRHVISDQEAEPSVSQTHNELHYDSLHHLCKISVKYFTTSASQSLDGLQFKLGHELFDTSAGLVPGIPYTVSIHHSFSRNNVYLLKVNQGRLLARNGSGTQLCQNDEAPDDSQLVFNAPANVTWTTATTPTSPVPVKFTLVAFLANTMQIVGKHSIDSFILPGCFLKVYPSQGTVSSSFFWGESRHNNDAFAHKEAVWDRRRSLSCVLVLMPPSAVHTVEINLRKLKLARSQETCNKDSVIQIGNVHQSVDADSVTWYSALDDEQHLIVARNYCGKAQDYFKNERNWKSENALPVFIRFTIGGKHFSSNFFSLKFIILGPCSNALFTQRHGRIDVTGQELLINSNQEECTFRIHFAYGNRVQLRVRLWSAERSELVEEQFHFNKSLLSDGRTANSQSDDATNLALLENGQCLIVVYMEDASGQHTRCLAFSEQHDSVFFVSQTNFLDVRALHIGKYLRPGLKDFRRERENNETAASGDDNTTANDAIKEAESSSPRLTIFFSAVAQTSLSDGCEPDWVASDEVTCISVQNRPLDWHQAEAKCNFFGGHLVAISNKFVQQIVETSITSSPFYESSRSYWIGGTDLKHETVFEWTNGEPMTFTKWFPGWSAFHGYNAQPSDDGFSNQDCIEIRQTFGQPGRDNFVPTGLFWNDRDCSVANPFVCERPRNSSAKKSLDLIDCNRTEELDRSRTSIIITSPRHPMPYPDSLTCTTHLVAPVGYSILLNFQHFDIEDEEDCNYDFVELVEPLGSPKNRSAVQRGTHQPDYWKRCGNWNTRLKLLRWQSKGNRVEIRFSSDSSYNGHGFQLTALLEKTDLNCPEATSISHRGHCYLIVPYPEAEWSAAREICHAVQAELVLPDSDELQYLTSLLESDDQLNATGFYWIGQAGNFQLSILHSSDAIHHCPSVRTWSTPGNMSLEPCQSRGGYICETTTKNSNNGGMRNSTIESREGQIKSPNYPLHYSNNVGFRLHIKAPNASVNHERLIIRFKDIDIEYQENCLYDYVGLQEHENGSMTKFCGRHTTDLEKLDFISLTTEAWLTFYSDYSTTGTGFHAAWMTIPLPGCPQQVISHPPTGLIRSPHFPHYYLPHLNCTHLLLAPDNMRVSIEFQVLEVGHSNPSALVERPCFHDYVRVTVDEKTSTKLCGLHHILPKTKNSFRYLSFDNRLSVQLISLAGKQGRGFLASYRFETIPVLIQDALHLGENETVDLHQLNTPMPMPLNVSHQLKISTPHGSFIRFTSRTLEQCSSIINVAVRAIINDFYNKEMRIELCSGSSETNYVYESLFNTMTVTYEQLMIGQPVVIGRIEAVSDGNYTQKVADWSSNSPVEECNLNPCQNDGVCKTNDSFHYCECRGKWRGLFCSVSLCELSLCIHGSCKSANDSQICVCEVGFTGALCDTAVSACDLDPCQGRGDCFNTENGGFHCQCHAWWQGPRCETRWLQIPYKPLSQRMFEEPFWLGLMTMAVVLVIIALVWCVKRHFAEKLERFITEELERGKLVNDYSPNNDWRRSRNRPSLDPTMHPVLQGLSRPSSPQSTSLNIPNTETTQRNFLGFRKPSLLSITSLLNPCQMTNAVSPGRRDTGRTFSLDDLFRNPRRSPSPAPGKRLSDNDVAATQRRDSERQKILQRLVASHVSRSTRTRTSENFLMTPLATDGKSVPGRHSLTGDEQSTDTDTMVETIIGPSVNSQLDLKAEKRVTFARMLDLVSMELHSSSETDISAGEEAASIRSANQDQKSASNSCDQRHPPRRKNRSWNSRRFWRAPNSNSSTQGSASDHDIDLIQTNPVNPASSQNESKNTNPIIQRRSNRLLRLPCRTATEKQSSSTESLLTIIRNFSSTHKTPSTPSSPQMSDYELSSSFPTPISTPGSPAGSLETLPSAACNADSSHSIQVAVIDPLSVPRGSRSCAPNLNTPHITLEIPTPNYSYLSPIHEVPTPLPSPSHTPLPSLRRQNAVPSSDSSFGSPQMKHRADCDMSETDEPKSLIAGRPRLPSITICCDDGTSVEVLVGSKQGDGGSALSSPSFTKTRPPPLSIVNSNFARFEKNQHEEQGAVAVVQSMTFAPPLPTFCISEPSPEESSEGNNSASYWEQIAIGSPPVRKNLESFSDASFANEGLVRRVLKDTAGDKSNSLDLPAAPPMITITANFSEVESDTDTGLLGGGGINGQNKMCYLSPFHCYGGRQDIGASESNLSSSGYSSMASPGPSPSCSSKTLSVLENEDISLTRVLLRRSKEKPILHRTLSPSLESSSPPHDSPPVQKDSLVFPTIVGPILQGTDSDVTDDQFMIMPEPIEHESTADYDDSNDEGIDVDHIREKIDSGELRSARELENFIQSEMHRPESSNVDLKLLNVCTARVQKSRSLDSKLKGERQNKVKSDSLDTKLLTLQPAEGTLRFTFQSLRIPETATTSWLPQAAGDSLVGEEPKKRSSPVSSRSESPLSDAKTAGFGRFSAQFYGMSRPDFPYTDSDGLYDYPSSEAVLPIANITRRNSKKCDRRRERKASLQMSRLDNQDGALFGRSGRLSLLEPGTDRTTTRCKRRIRTHSHADIFPSSSSNESLSTSRRRTPRKTCRRHSRSSNRQSSPSFPVCDVILTVQAASSAEESETEISHSGSGRFYTEIHKKDIRALKLPSRSRYAGRLLNSRLRKSQENLPKRREQSTLKARRPVSRESSPPPDSEAVARRDSFSSCFSDSDHNDSNESLANLAEIDDSTDSPVENSVDRKT